MHKDVSELISKQSPSSSEKSGVFSNHRQEDPQQHGILLKISLPCIVIEGHLVLKSWKAIPYRTTWDLAFEFQSLFISGGECTFSPPNLFKRMLKYAFFFMWAVSSSLFCLNPQVSHNVLINIRFLLPTSCVNGQERCYN